MNPKTEKFGHEPWQNAPYADENQPTSTSVLGVCSACIRGQPQEALAAAKRAHQKMREDLGLPSSPPGDAEGVSCNICVNRCRMAEDEMGYCGLRRNRCCYKLGFRCQVSGVRKQMT